MAETTVRNETAAVNPSQIPLWLVGVLTAVVTVPITGLFVWTVARGLPIQPGLPARASRAPGASASRPSRPRARR
jgi:hypothetical protein